MPTLRNALKINAVQAKSVRCRQNITFHFMGRYTNATSNGGDASRVGKIKRKCTSPGTARYAICPSRHSRGVMPVRSLNILYNWLRDVKPQADDTLSMVYSGWALM